VRARGGYGGRRSRGGAGLGAESWSGAGKEGPTGGAHAPERESGEGAGVSGMGRGEGVGRARAGEKREGKKERGRGLGASGPRVEERREWERRAAGWAGLQKEKEREEKQAGRAGPKGEKREEKERGETKCGRTNLNYTGSSTRVHSRGLQRASNGIIPWPVG
jgi:hypothetical protein